MAMPGYDSSDSSWSDTKGRRKSNGVTHQKFKKLGTNVHSSMGGGVSVHNALMSLEPPPPDAKPGSKHAPWLRLTDWEMMMLRKRMKKNAKWRPSESMVKVELIGFGRGPHNYWEAKKKAEAEGVEFLDVDNIAAADPDKPRAWGEVGLTAPSSSEDIPRNKGMALNEAKKRKRDEFLASASQRSSKNVSDDGLPTRKQTALNSAGKRPRGRPAKNKTQDVPKAELNHTASQYSKPAPAQIYTDTTSDESQAGDEVDSDGSFSPYATEELEPSRASLPHQQRRNILESDIDSSKRSAPLGELGHLAGISSRNAQPHAKPASEPLLEHQRQQGTPDTPENKSVPNHFATNVSPAAKTAGVSQQSHGSPASKTLMGVGEGRLTTSSEPPMLQQTQVSLPAAAARDHTTASPQPSTATPANPLQQLLSKSHSKAATKDHTTTDPKTASETTMNPLQRLFYKHPSTTAAKTHTTTDPKPASVTPANPLQRLLYSHPSTASSHGQPQSSPPWSNNAGSRPNFDTYTSASPQPSTTVAKNPHPQQLYDSPSSVAARGPANAIRTPQVRRPGVLFDHRESLSKIVGHKRPVPKATHFPAELPPMVQSSPPVEPSQVHIQPSATKPSPASKPSASKPGPKPKAKPGPKPKGKPGPKPKPKPEADGPPPKKRKYIPGGPGGGGRYVDI